MPTQQYYVRVRGEVSGPFAEADLVLRAKRGLFAAFHQVSTDGVNWMPASSVPHLFQSGTRAVSTGTRDAVRIEITDETSSSPMPVPAVPETAAPSRARPSDVRTGTLDADALLHRFMLASMVSGALLVLLAANLPHARDAGSLTWWWQLSTASGGTMTLLLGIYSVLVVLVLLSSVWLVRPVSRGWLVVAAGGLGIVLLLTTTIVLGTTWLPYVAASLPPVFTVLLGTAALLITSRPDHDEPRRLAQACGTVIVPVFLAGAVAVVMLAIRASSPGTGLSLWPVAALVFWGLGQAGIVVSVVSTWTWRQSDTDSRRQVTLIVATSLAALILVLLAGIATALGGAADGGSAARFHALQVVRLLVASVTCLLLACVGTFEILYYRFAPSASEESPWKP